ncbi:MAG: septation protein SpoVG family protein [Candidatus Omnitrophica bacterium]|nr:septation protein SpoVG family protein [Candidatus Omnitrophota bacterium]MCM8798205.1 septation protein SpoVG family protein [Candidatus Omnitrophota bacterium]
MEITEVRILLKNKDKTNRRLKAYATVTFDDVFVVRNIKVIEGREGLFVAMPSRKMQSLCPKCGHNNTIHSRFCNQCGQVLESQPVSPSRTPSERQAEHRDIAHPITQEFREYLQKKVLEAYEKEIKRSAPA